MSLYTPDDEIAMHVARISSASFGGELTVDENAEASISSLGSGTATRGAHLIALGEEEGGISVCLSYTEGVAYHSPGLCISSIPPAGSSCVMLGDGFNSL